MYSIESPSVCLNDERAEAQYEMDVTKRVSENESIEQLVEFVFPYANKMVRNKVRGIASLVLVGHGGPGIFQLGAGLDRGSMGPFGRLSGKVRMIWFKGCLVGRIMSDVTPQHGDAQALADYGFTSGDGHAFLSEFARLTLAYVIAPTELQASNRRTYPRGQIDVYEGLVLCYDPNGNVSWQHRYPSVYGHDTAHRAAVVPNTE